MITFYLKNKINIISPRCLVPNKRTFSMTYIIVLSTILLAKSKLMLNFEWKTSHPLPYLHVPPTMVALFYWWYCCLLKFFSSSAFKISGKFSGQHLGKKEAKLAWSTINWWVYLMCIIITCNIVILSFYVNFMCRLKRSKKTWENVRRYVYCNHDKHWRGKRFCAN